MNTIIDFYKSLDLINLIIFWGIIIIITLLLTFSIIISNKNKKLKEIINNNQKNVSKKEIPITKEINNNYIQQSRENTSNIEKILKDDNKIFEEKNFIAEEHVMEYNKDLFSIPNIKKTTDTVDNVKSSETNKIPNKPYQKNVLKEISTSQTSPIGLVTPIKKEVKQAQELTEILNNYDNNTNLEKNLFTNKSHNIQQASALNDVPKLKKEELRKDETKEDKQKNYLEKISKALEESQNNNTLKRTEYEMQQEEDAIISYEELMKKKDSIKIADEEEAIISIEELVKRQQSEKIYNLTEEEENENFIRELKDFRNNL